MHGATRIQPLRITWNFAFDVKSDRDLPDDMTIAHHGKYKKLILKQLVSVLQGLCLKKRTSLKKRTIQMGYSSKYGLKRSVMAPFLEQWYYQSMITPMI